MLTGHAACSVVVPMGGVSAASPTVLAHACLVAKPLQLLMQQFLLNILCLCCLIVYVFLACPIAGDTIGRCSRRGKGHSMKALLRLWSSLASLERQSQLGKSKWRSSTAGCGPRVLNQASHKQTLGKVWGGRLGRAYGGMKSAAQYGWVNGWV